MTVLLHRDNTMSVANKSFTAADALRKLEATLQALEASLAFRSAQQFCIDDRHAWGLIWMKWHEARSPARDEQLAGFIGLCDRGLAAMKGVTPANDEERQDLADFQRNCGRRHGFAVALRDKGEAVCEALIRETIEREEVQLAAENP